MIEATIEVMAIASGSRDKSPPPATAAKTIMAIMISPNFTDEAEELLANLKDEVNFEEINDLSPYKGRIRNEVEI